MLSTQSQNYRPDVHPSVNVRARTCASPYAENPRASNHMTELKQLYVLPGYMAASRAAGMSQTVNASSTVHKVHVLRQTLILEG